MLRHLGNGLESIEFLTCMEVNEAEMVKIKKQSKQKLIGQAGY